MNLKYQSGTLFDVKFMTIEMQKGSKSFEIEIAEEKGELSATIRDMDSNIEILIVTKRVETLEDLFAEINIHLSDMK